MSSCLDLREFQNSSDMSSIMGKLVSGRSGYKAVIEKKKEISQCKQCGKILDDSWKFCPECGTKIER
jgi:rRNA maturation endonuclease Nob1